MKPCNTALQEARAASVRALTDGVLLALHRDDFNKLLGSLLHIRHMWRFEALRKARLMSQASQAKHISGPHRFKKTVPPCRCCMQLREWRMG